MKIDGQSLILVSIGYLMMHYLVDQTYLAIFIICYSLIQGIVFDYIAGDGIVIRFFLGYHTKKAIDLIQDNATWKPIVLSIYVLLSTFGLLSLIPTGYSGATIIAACGALTMHNGDKKISIAHHLLLMLGFFLFSVGARALIENYV